MVGFTVYQFLPPQDTPGLREELQVFKVQFNLQWLSSNQAFKVQLYLQCLHVGLVQTRFSKFSFTCKVLMLA